MWESLTVLALVLTFAGSSSAALLTYDGFDYTPTALLSAQTNPGTGQAWAFTGPETDDMAVVSDNLTVTGLAASTGNAVGYGGAGKSDRIGWGSTVSSGSVYYSLAIKITDVTNAPTTGVFIGGFNTATGTQAAQPGTVLSRLLIKQTSSSTYQIGLDRSQGSAGLFQFAGGDRNVGDTQYVVVAWDIVPGGSNDVARMWVNPNPANFGAGVEPVADLTIPNNGTQLDTSISSFLLRQNAIVPAGVVADELRIGTTWAEVTPPIPEPAMIGAAGLVSLLLLQRRRA